MSLFSAACSDFYVYSLFLSPNFSFSFEYVWSTSFSSSAAFLSEKIAFLLFVISWNSGDWLYYSDCGKPPQVALFLYTLLGSIFPPLSHSLFLHVCFKHPSRSYPTPAVSSWMAEHCVSYCHTSERSGEGFRCFYCTLMGKRNGFLE